MKRIISLICTLLLIASFSLGVFAYAKEKTYTINGEFESLTCNDGQTYYPIDNTDLYLEAYDREYLDYEFSDKNIEKKIQFVDVSVSEKSNYIIEVYIEYGSITEYMYFVRSDKKEWMDEFLKGKNASHIITENSRSWVDRYLDFEKVENWISEENKITVTAKQFRFFSCHSVYITDNSKEVRLQVGDVYENGEEFYFVRYSDYTKADLYGDGTYANLSVAYKLSDEAYIEEMKETYSEDATETVDEEIMQSDEKIEGILTGFTELSLIVMIVLFLVLIPLAAIVLSIIFLFVKHAAPMYRGWLKAIIITAVVVLVCSVTIIIILF